MLGTFVGDAWEALSPSGWEPAEEGVYGLTPHLSLFAAIVRSPPPMEVCSPSCSDGTRWIVAQRCDPECPFGVRSQCQEVPTLPDRTFTACFCPAGWRPTGSAGMTECVTFDGAGGCSPGGSGVVCERECGAEELCASRGTDDDCDGTVDEGCCDPVSFACPSGSVCTEDYVCVPCGGDGQPCCPSGGETGCGDGLSCIGRLCRPCGSVGLQCCDTGAPAGVCNDGSWCDFSFTCSNACGARGEPCCRVGEPCEDPNPTVPGNQGWCAEDSANPGVFRCGECRLRDECVLPIYGGPEQCCSGTASPPEGHCWLELGICN